MAATSSRARPAAALALAAFSAANGTKHSVESVSRSWRVSASSTVAAAADASSLGLIGRSSSFNRAALCSSTWRRHPASSAGATTAVAASALVCSAQAMRPSATACLNSTAR